MKQSPQHGNEAKSNWERREHGTLGNKGAWLNFARKQRNKLNKAKILKGELLTPPAVNVRCRPGYMVPAFSTFILWPLIMNVFKFAEFLDHVSIDYVWIELLMLKGDW